MYIIVIIIYYSTITGLTIYNHKIPNTPFVSNIYQCVSKLTYFLTMAYYSYGDKALHTDITLEGMLYIYLYFIRYVSAYIVYLHSIMVLECAIACLNIASFGSSFFSFKKQAQYFTKNHNINFDSQTETCLPHEILIVNTLW